MFATTESGISTSVQIGDNNIRVFTDGKIWIEKPDGEGMECDNEELAKVIDAFYEREM